MAPRHAPPSHDAVVAAQADLIDSLPNVEPDWAAHSCWACGLFGEGFQPERAHLVAHTHGGSFDPDNVILLCWRCHKEQPDGASRAAQVAWLRTHQGYLERLLPTATALTKAIHEASGQYGGDAVMREFGAHVWNGGADTARRRWGRAAGSSLHQASSNGLWALLDYFHVWARAHRAPPGTQLSLLHDGGDDPQ